MTDTRALALVRRADECRAHAEASHRPTACIEYRAKEWAFREAAAIIAEHDAQPVVPAGEVEVSQADRAAAADIYRRFRYGATADIHAKIRREVERGKRDDDPLIQVFARHRLAHATPPVSGKIAAAPADNATRRFALGDRVSKTKGSSWHGRIVGFYSTLLTPEGCVVESDREPGSVQLYPAAALQLDKEEGR